MPDSGSVTVIMDLSKRDSRTMQNVPDSSSTTANAQVGHREAHSYLPDSSSVTVNMDDVEVGHGGVAWRLAWLVLKLIQVAALGESVDSQHLSQSASCH